MNKAKIMEELEKRFENAKAILNDEEKAEEFTENIEDRFNSSLKNKNSLFFVRKIQLLKTYIPLFISLVKSYVKKEYREIPFGTILAIVAALIYSLTPIDVIPDFIPGFGFVDDASVIAFCFLSCKHDLDNYRKWLKQMDVIDVEVKKKAEQSIE